MNYITIIELNRVKNHWNFGDYIRGTNHFLCVKVEGTSTIGMTPFTPATLTEHIWRLAESHGYGQEEVKLVHRLQDCNRLHCSLKLDSLNFAVE